MTEKQIYDHFIKNKLTPAGSCGLMANLKAESGLIFNRVEILCLKRLKEHGKSYTDDSYTSAIDEGKISRSEFLNPLPGKQYGYGLAQWTSPGRKAGLYDLCKKRNVSISNPQAQLDHLITELITSYPTVYKVLTTTQSVKEASDIVLVKFECPADTGNAIKNLRASYGQAYYNKYAFKEKNNKENAMTTNEAILKLMKFMKSELGYCEKASNSQLDSKTANAGYNNYTKYWRDIANWGLGNYQAQYWCAAFIFWCFVKTFGLENSKKMLLHAPFINCQTIYTLFAQKSPGKVHKTPKRGRLVVFKRGSVFGHVGIVTSTTATTFTTYEGNTSNQNGVIANGGMVCKKTYNTSQMIASGARFIKLDWSVVATGFEIKKGKKYTLTKDIAIRTTYSTKSRLAGYVKYKDIPDKTKEKVIKVGVNCKLKSGNTVQALDVKKSNTGDTWIRIKNGWLPVRVGNVYRIKE